MVSVDPTDVAVFIITFTKKHGRTPLVGEILRVQQETENAHDRRAVCILKKSSMIVVHVPRELSRVFWFLCHGGTINLL